MVKFDRLMYVASKLASDNGTTIQELLRDTNLGYNSRSSIYQDFRNLENSFGLSPYNTEENRGKSGREAVYRLDKKDWDEFKSEFLTKALSDKERRRLSFMLESIGSLSPLVNVSKDDIIPKLNSIIGDISIDSAKYGGYFNLETTKNLDTLLEAQETKEMLYITYYGERKELFVLKCFVFSGGTYCYVMNQEGKSYMLSVQRIERVERQLIKKNVPYPKPDVDIDKALSDPFGTEREAGKFEVAAKQSAGQGYKKKGKIGQIV